MFREWGFLITEMVVLLILAALLGLIVGWIVWGRRREDGTGDALVGRLRADLEGCHAAGLEKDRRIAELEQSLAASNDKIVSAAAALVKGGELEVDAAEVSKSAVADAETGARPEALSAAREGGPDDLKRISGVGPKLEALCHRLGFFHYDQIAAWTAEEVAWVDANLEGFKGRVTRDGWVAQAKRLAEEQRG